MTVTAVKTRLTEHVEVEHDDAGSPRRVHWRGRWYAVDAAPVRWFQRRRWWAEEPRAERGRPGLVSEEIWRVQLSAEPIPLRCTPRPSAADDPAPQQCTVDLGRSLPSDRWRAVRVHEAVE